MPYLSVAIGGFFGAVTRYLLSEWMGTLKGFPIGTAVINLAGSFFLAWFYTITLEKLPIHPLLRLGLGTGFVGAFTTFSTMTVELWSLIHTGMYEPAAIYLALTFAGGLFAAGLGYALAIRQSALRFRKDGEEM